MIPRKLWTDVCSYNLPVILVGDLVQLEPVGDDPKLMKNPHVTLDRIHRQAEQSSIVSLATKVRTGDPRAFSTPYNEQEVKIIRPRQLTDDLLLSSDIMICAFNRTRLALNRKVRDMQGRKETLEEGDSIICLQNNQRIGCFNGQMFTVKEIINDDLNTYNADIVCELGQPLRVRLWKEQFGHAKNLAREGEWKKSMSSNKKYFAPYIKEAEKYMFADYGYAITCHKSQGSEWDKVLVIDEQSPKLWDANRWRYTAITRAAKMLTYVL